MTQEQKQVREFMQLFDHPCQDKPTIPNDEIRLTWAKLIWEEATEVIKALGFIVHQPYDRLGTCFNPVKPNLTEIADGIADTDYVIKGAANACGLDIEPIFAEVHRSNMSKMWTDKDITHTNHAGILLPSGAYDIGKTRQVNDLLALKVAHNTWLVKNKDGKVIKSPSYSPANLQPIIDKQCT